VQIFEEHIKEHLIQFLDLPDEGFEIIYNQMAAENKSDCNDLLKYIDKLLNRSLNFSEEKKLKLTYLHLDHFPEAYCNTIIEFISLKFFHSNLNKVSADHTQSAYLENKLFQLRSQNSKYKSYPPFVSLQKPNREAKKWLNEKKEINQRLNYFSSLSSQKPGLTFLPNTLINLLQKEYEYVLMRAYTHPFCIDVNSIQNDSSYVILNNDKGRDTLDALKNYNNEPLLDGIENIVLFNCEQKQIYRDFNQKDLQEWNNTGSSNFKNLLIISTKEDRSKFQNLKHRSERIQSRYQHADEKIENCNYIVLGLEIDTLLGRSIKIKPPTIFIGESTLSFWDDFKLLLTHYESLYELRSLKMMSIYSLVVNQAIKNRVLSSIFSQTSDSEIITRETKSALHELSAENIEELQELLSLVLDTIIKSDWIQNLSQYVKDGYNFIINENIIPDKLFTKEISKALNLPTSRLVNWKDLDGIKKDVVTLDYRDIGPYPYSMRPNFYEPLSGKYSLQAIFISFFFKTKFDWTNYNHRKDFISIINNPIRNNIFKSDLLISKNLSLRPQKDDSTIWDIESTYHNLKDSNSIRVIFSDSKSKVYYTSELFIVSSVPGTYRVARLDSIIEDYHDISIQALDDIHSEFNLYEKLANVRKEEAELNTIREKYGLSSDIKPHILWKILLNNHIESNGKEKLYETVKEFLLAKKLKLVSFYTFQHSWLNLESDAFIPREKKVFYYLCEFLDLPKSYFRIMLRLKNVEKLATATSSRQMDNLLKDIINDGCFNDDVDVESILNSKKQKYIKNHDFDEIGLDIDRISIELVALVELLKPNISLRPIVKIEINN
jgi:hypothetical protein